MQSPKLKTLEQAVAHREQLRGAGRRVVPANGCFALLHPGRVTWLRLAAELGDALFIGLNSDASSKASARPA